MKIICVGRNYSLHAAELGNEIPEEPVLFLKPDSALVPKNNPFVIPAFSNDIHYECELVLRIGRAGKHIKKSLPIATSIALDSALTSPQETSNKN